MKSIVPAQTPAEVLKIAPENLEIANAYLTYQSLTETAHALNIGTDIVSQVLSRTEVKAYVNNVFMDLGFNNRFKMQGIMDEIIKQKLQELEDAEIGSQKDIIEILALQHKMTMEILDKEIKLETLKSGVKNQTNVQLNNYGGNHSSLIERLISNDLKTF